MAFLVGNALFNSLVDSFASVSFADDYHEKRGNLLWATLNDDAKEQLLIKATDYIKNVYYGKWLAGFVDTNVVPMGLAQATVELALIANSQSLLATVARGKKKVKVGPIEVEYDGNAPTATKFVAASLMIIPFLRVDAFNSNIARLTRA